MDNRNDQLDRLFNKWKEKWEKDDSMNGKKFYPDGFLNREYTEDIEILFLLKESNEGSNDNKKIELEHTNFWASRMVTKTLEENKENKDVSSAGNRIMNRLKWIREYIDIGEKKISTRKSEEDDGLPYYCLKDCAFMNINKSGGVEKANNSEIKKIRRKDACYIKSEIDIIAPKHIVAMGANMEDLLGDELLGKIREKTRIVWHPSCFKSNDDYMQNVKVAFGKANENVI